MAVIKRYVNGQWEEIPVTPEVPEVTGVVRTTPQELTDSEKEQVRVNIDAISQSDLDNVIGALEDSDTTYTLSKSGNTITLVGNDNSMTSVEESVTVASDDDAGNVILESTAGISYLTESIKQEIIDAVLASLTTETLTFTLDDGTTVVKEVVVK